MRIFSVVLILIFFACTPPPDSTDASSGSPAVVESTSTSGGFFDVEEITDTSASGTVYTFPVFSSPGDNLSHERINEILQTSELELNIGQQDSSIFENIWPSDGFSGTTEFNYTITANSDKFLSVEFIKEGCGAYCEGYSTYYNFDASTGEQIELPSLFTENGLNELRKIITDERINAINDVINKTTDDDVKSLFTECLEYMNSDMPGTFYIEGANIHFIRERCSNHAMAGLDEIGDFDNVRSFAELEPYMSEYGKGLLR